MADSIFAEQRRWLEDGDDSMEEEEKGPLQLFSVIMSNALLFFLIFGLSATVEVKNLRQQLTNKHAIATGVAMQFIIMPFLGFVAIVLLKDTEFSQAMGVTLLVVTASPGGSYSNWWCSLFNAELALSVAMTSVSSVLSVGLLPANMLLYSWLAFSVVIPPEDGDDELNIIQALDFGAIFITLGVVMGAILIGLYAGYKFDNALFHTRANKFGSVCGISLILFSAFLGSGAGGAETNFWSLPWSFYVGVAFPCVVGMTLANIISRSFRLSPPETVAISIECCYQNTAIATSVAVTMFSDPTERAEAVSVPLFYGLVEAVIIAIYCVWAWKVGWTKAPANEKICVVVTHTYEVAEEAQHEFDEPIDQGTLTWWGRMFIPREQMESFQTETGSKDIDKSDPRTRFYSADVTVATSTATPGTPETTLESIPQEMDMESVEYSPDLEAPSIQGDGDGDGDGDMTSAIGSAQEACESGEQQEAVEVVLSEAAIYEQAPPVVSEQAPEPEQKETAVFSDPTPTRTPEETQEAGPSQFLPELQKELVNAPMIVDMAGDTRSASSDDA
jgi:predicted Na+-dependent transporter